MAITITSPASGANVSGTVNVVGTSSQTVSGGTGSTPQTLSGQAFSIPYNTTALANGVQNLSAGNGVATANVSVNVNNTQTASPDGTTIPSATQIIDNNGDTWTTVGGVVKKNGANAGFTSQVILLLWYQGTIWQENSSNLWWPWNSTTWTGSGVGDPRGVSPTLTVTSPAAGATVSSPVSVSGTTNQSSVVVKEGSTTLATLTPSGGNFSGSITLAAGAHTLVFSAGTATPVSRSITASAVTQKLFYGMNIHHTASIYQSLGTAPVVGYLQDLGCTVARTDVYDPNDSTIVSWCSALSAGGITPLPILISARVDGDETTSYNNGFALGQGIANKVKAYTSYYEMGNEIDDQCSPNLDGLTPACYNLAQWQGARGALRGVYAGVKSVQSGATLIFAGVTVLDEGFINGMATGVDPSGSGHPVVSFDATGWHWYETSGDPTNTGSSGGAAPCGSPNGGLNMLKFAGGLGDGTPSGTSQFSARSAWWTEIGNAAADSQSQQSAYVTAILTQLYNNRVAYNITNFCWYELIYVAGSGGNYSLINSDGVTKRTAYTTFKNFVAAHPV